MLSKLGTVSKMTSEVIASKWSPSSYTNYKRYIDYFSPEDKVFSYLSTLPGIVSVDQIRNLKGELKQCEEGRRVLIHTGDCAEPFEHVNNEILQNKAEFFKTCGSVIQSLSKKPAVKIGRIAGQYAKPRSSEFMFVEGKKVHNYKGDNVNEQSVQNREPKEDKLTQGYFNSVVTHNFLSLQKDLNLYTSHEGLIIPYEASLTRKHTDENYYCQSAHMLWIGERTRQLDGGHVEFFRGVSNPIGVKVSSKISEEEFVSLIRTLNPKNETGKLLVIIRMGKDAIQSKLKSLIECKVKEKLNFMFVSDPMHGNTFQSSFGDNLKTRNFEDIYSELDALKTEVSSHSLPWGLSLEATFQDVSECYGGAYPFEEKDVKKERYKTKCDPRLNWNQTLHLLHKVFSK